MLLAAVPAGRGDSVGEPDTQGGPTILGASAVASDLTIEAWLQDLDASISSMGRGFRKPHDANE
jgi:hypothetical protein